jgi:hypothetical protein
MITGTSISMPMRETLDELAKAAAALNSETDQLNELIGDFETELERAGVGVSHWMQQLLDESPIEQRYRATDKDEKYPIDVTRGWVLGFAKIDGRWCLGAKQVRVEDESGEVKIVDEKPPVALVKAPRIVRMEAAAQFEALAKELTIKMRAYLASIGQAKQFAKIDESTRPKTEAELLKDARKVEDSRRKKS